MSEPGKVLSKTETITYKNNFGGPQPVESVVVRRNRTTPETIDQFNRIYKNILGGGYYGQTERIWKLSSALRRTMNALGATGRGTIANNHTATLLKRRNNR